LDVDLLPLDIDVVHLDASLPHRDVDRPRSTAEALHGARAVASLRCVACCSRARPRAACRACEEGAATAGTSRAPTARRDVHETDGDGLLD
jgi:hypothetical protein